MVHKAQSMGWRHNPVNTNTCPDARLYSEVHTAGCRLQAATKASSSHIAGNVLGAYVGKKNLVENFNINNIHSSHRSPNTVPQIEGQNTVMHVGAIHSLLQN